MNPRTFRKTERNCQNRGQMSSKLIIKWILEKPTVGRIRDMVFSESTAPQSFSVGLEALNGVLYHGALRLRNDVSIHGVLRVLVWVQFGFCEGGKNFACPGRTSKMDAQPSNHSPPVGL